ncbi:FAD/NAD(P)-binding domain-containing protein [Eremomyces bilateralis CBS 781.70]|uniref:FAD/NAD(P)-binding domain-containing protein n=1 Tax=Eremomyces bilateralis CBS 781.70 TaxID=1392243 RepID=A0A6G1FY57_9PEZI|nr:FAD/NAD(P)-binding domain-containing protein [Eremomyces bilateralis CBS 781.70]KAF1810519.1 FAD/NAD(P)-binding domain-containing protein [Eremomyces bilateralis CBS 781.70]
MAKRADVVIVGAGIGGLAAAVALLTESQLSQTPYNITVLESASEICEIGAGIQVTPNFTRLLDQWGLADEIARTGWKPGQVKQVRWQNGAELTKFPLNRDDRMKNQFGYYYFHIHRADLHGALMRRAEQLGTKMYTKSNVVKYIPRTENSKDTVETVDGRKFEADLVIAADGAKSMFIKEVLGTDTPAEPTGDCAYRGMMRRECVQDPAFEGLELENGSVVWLGHGAHIVGYLIRGGEFYNLVVLMPEGDDIQEESWTLKGEPKKLKDFFETWDPRLRKLLEMVDTTYMWSLRDRPALEKWVHPTGNLVLIGDAAHPMLPYVGQGAASAAEDAAALAECLNAVGERHSLRDVLDAFQKLRIPRAFSMREAGRRNRQYFHFPDGQEQRERDQALAKESETSSTPNQLNDDKVLQGMYGYDVIKEAKALFEG